MRKRLIPLASTTPHELLLDLDTTTTVEVTSEDKEFPIESSFSPENSRGWRAAEPGTQAVRLLFDKPQKLKRISLLFEEEEAPRTQEFVLRWSPASEGPFREIVRQQWNFSPPSTMREVEDYRVELSGVAILELTITPNISGGTARSSLKSLRLS